jgi:Holliday junction resolvase
VSRGLDRERQVCSLLREEGWWAKRGGMGEVDVIAIRPGPVSDGRITSTVRFIQVKSTKAGPFHSFGPGRRKALLSDAYEAGATAELCWWPSRGKPKWIQPWEWPA